MLFLGGFAVGVVVAELANWFGVYLYCRRHETVEVEEFIPEIPSQAVDSHTGQAVDIDKWFAANTALEALGVRMGQKGERGH